MKKPTLFFILLLFAACAVVGYLLASKTQFGSNSSNAGAADDAALLSSSQQNLLLVRVDDLSASDPQLIEAWMVLTLYSDPPQIMFVPIYPRYDTGQDSTLASAFALDSQGNLSAKFSDKVASMFGVSVHGVILTDAAGMNAIAGWFGIDGISAGTLPASSEGEKHAILLNSQTFFLKVCQQLKDGRAMQQYASIYWSQLAPLHFQTDMSFEVLNTSWDRVNHSAPPQQCDVISSE